MSFYDALLFSRSSKGERGYSAYEIAVQNGYEGTEEEWSESFLNAENYYDKTQTDNKLKEKIYHFNDVAEMKSSTKLKIGDVVETLGYYAESDGGTAKYRVRAKTNDETADEKIIIEINNNLIAELIIEKNFNILQLGAKKDNSNFDNSPIIKKSLETSHTAFIPFGTYYCTTTIDLDNMDQISSEMATIYYTGSDKLFNHSDSNEITRVLVENLFLIGNGQNNCFYLNKFIDSKLENLRIFNFKLGLNCLYSWDSEFDNIRFQACSKPMALGSQFNNSLFKECAFSSYTSPFTFTNCEAVTLLSCDITNCLENAAFTLYHSSVKLINCYYENLRAERTIIGGYNETVKSILDIDGGNLTGYNLEVDMYKGSLILSETLHYNFYPVSHKEADKMAVGDQLKSLILPTSITPSLFNSVVFFDGTQNPSISFYQTTQGTKIIENGLLKITIPDNDSNYKGISFPLEQGKNYILVLEGRFTGENTSQKIVFQEFSGISYSVGRSFADDNKIIVPIYAFSTRIYLKWAVTETLELSKLILKKLD